MGKSRRSGIELLRILAILFIIISHYSYHGGLGTVGFLPTVNQIIVNCGSCFGKLMCAVFALISGYFLITSEASYSKHYKKIIPLIAEMMFYSVLIFAFFVVFGKAELTPINIIKALFPMFWGCWYVVYYIIIYIFVPFINRWIKATDEKTLRLLIFAFVVVWSVVPTFTLDAWSFSQLAFFVVYYFIGAYIRLYRDKPVSKKNCVIVIAVTVMLMMLSTTLFLFVGAYFDSEKIIKNSSYFCGYDSVLVIPCAIALLLYFKDLKFESTLVNAIAASVLGIYLIHENDYMRHFLWTEICPNADYINSFAIYLQGLVKIVAVFAGCLLVDLVRERTVGRLFNKMLDKYYSTIWDKISSCTKNLIFK